MNYSTKRVKPAPKAAPNLTAILKDNLEWLEAMEAEEPEDWDNRALKASIRKTRAALAGQPSTPTPDYSGLIAAAQKVKARHGDQPPTDSPSPLDQAIYQLDTELAKLDKTASLPDCDAIADGIEAAQDGHETQP